MISTPAPVPEATYNPSIEKPGYDEYYLTECGNPQNVDHYATNSSAACVSLDDGTSHCVDDCCS